jgi:3D (Asp-Asp-Asp) domain-containing protein
MALLLPPATERAPEPGRKLGRFSWTYYWTATESADARTKLNSVIRDKQCRVLSRVSSKFGKSLRLEGSGRLPDGRLVNVAGPCDCGVCFSVVEDQTRFGVGTKNRALLPFVSVAVDPRRVKIGTRLYIPELDGMKMPGQKPWGDFIHDGCVVADDVGGGVRDSHLDFFAYDRAHYDALNSVKKMKRVTVHHGGKRCQDSI